MNSVQQRILAQIENELIGRKYSVAQSSDYANTGRVLIYTGMSERVAVGFLRYDFQGDRYTLSINWHGKNIPSQVGREDYFDFYQAYNEPTRFWEVLAGLTKKQS